MRLASARSGANAKLSEIADFEVISNDRSVTPDFEGLPRQYPLRRNVEMTPWTPEWACRGAKWIGRADDERAKDLASFGTSRGSALSRP